MRRLYCWMVVLAYWSLAWLPRAEGESLKSRSDDGCIMAWHIACLSEHFVAVAQSIADTASKEPAICQDYMRGVVKQRTILYPGFSEQCSGQPDATPDIMFVEKATRTVRYDFSSQPTNNIEVSTIQFIKKHPPSK